MQSSLNIEASANHIITTAAPAAPAAAATAAFTNPAPVGLAMASFALITSLIILASSVATLRM